MQQQPKWWKEWVEPHWEDPRYKNALEILEHRTPEKRTIADWLVQRFGSSPGKMVDIGSGKAMAPDALGKLGWQLVLNDSAPETAEALRSRFTPPHRVVCCSALDPGSELSTIRDADLVGLTHMLYHVERARWPELFDLAHGMCKAGGKVSIALRSPGEYVNRLSARLGANILDVERDAAAWSARTKVPCECNRIPMSMEGLTRGEVLTLVMFMLRDFPFAEYSERVPEQDELEAMIEQHLFRGDACIWPYENTVVILG